MKSKNCETTNDILNPDHNPNGQPFNSPPWHWLFPIPLFPSSLSETLFRLAVLGLILLSLASRGHACGPDFPNNLLDGGDEAVLAAPLADFERELERLDLVPSRFDYVSATNGYQRQTFDAEMTDLAAALKKLKTPGEEAARTLESHRMNRQKFRKLQEKLDAWTNHHPVRAWTDDGGNSQDPRGPQPVIPAFDEVPGLPDEFVDYFAGAVAFRNPVGGMEAARMAWERLLARPATERKFKSTWAAFMLGKSWDGEDDDKAVEYFQMTRDLAKRGFADSTGLAVAAIGLEAGVELRRNHFSRAIDLYLEQYTAGDGSAVVSLRWAAGAALAAGGEELTALAVSADTRSVITAYLICGERGRRYVVDSDSPSVNPAIAWLEAMEAEHVSDVESAEQLALAAYQEGEFDIAQRWIKRARNTPVAQWLQAKLFLRAGQVSQAAALLAKVANLLPVTPDSETKGEESALANSLYVTQGSAHWNPAPKQVLGELGVLRLARREFAQALDALLNAGFWPDAAYVAERVLTTDELKTYVDKTWPTKKVASARSIECKADAESLASDLWREDIRHLLARRLTREMRSGEAREYYPAEWQPKFDELVAALNEGWSESAPAEARAGKLFTSAFIARTNGMELLGTELAPDWFVNGGGFDWGLTRASRASSSATSRVNIATEEEMNRAAQHGADPEARFHYRYQAAFLAWEAAKLMPNNSEETARVLCTAGTWLKLRDPDTADLFYKTLVRRCRKTAIGEQADRMRWFPILDENGNPKPYRPRFETVEAPASAAESMVPAETASDDISYEFPMPGKDYIVRRGDSLAGIARTVSMAGASVSVEQILEANPGLEVTGLVVGQRILIPRSSTEIDTLDVQSQPFPER